MRSAWHAVVWFIAAIVWFGGCAPAAYAGSTVLFDEGHGQKFLIENEGALDLSGLAAVFRSGSAQVRASREPITETRLSGVEALVVSGPFAPFTAAETDAISGFLNRGGRLGLMLHIPFPLAPLLRRLQVDFSNGVIRERVNLIGDDPLDFHVTALSPHALTRDVTTFDVYGAWALRNEGPGLTVVARTSATAWIDLNNNGTLEPRDAVQSFAVVVAGQMGAGRFAVFGDDAIFQNRFLTGGNRALASNLVAWLLPASPMAEADPPALPARGRKRAVCRGAISPSPPSSSAAGRRSAGCCR